MPEQPVSTSSRKRAGILVAVVLVLLLIALGIFVFVYARQPPQALPVAVTQPVELVTDARILYGGLPQPLDPAASYETLKNEAFIVGYSESRKDPLFCAYRVFRNPEPYNFPRPSSFNTDERTAAMVKTSDYTRSGYDRGHMAPNAAIMQCYGRNAQLETFLLTNVCPQAPNLNQRVWERLEVAERNYAVALEEIWVIDGPIFGDLNGGTTDRLASGIAVPTAFYKILLDEKDRAGGKARIFAVIMPQTVEGTELPQEFLVSVDQIEKETRLDFFWKLDDVTEGELEKRVWPMW